MAAGITKVYELTGSKGGITMEVTVTETYDTLKNKSDVSVSLRVKSSAYKYTYYLDGTVTLNGETLVRMNSATPTHYANVLSLNTYAQVTANDGYAASPWTLSGITHNTDGSKSVKLVISLKGYTVGGGGGSGWSVSSSETITLTHIPRASTIGASDANIESVSTISVTRKSTGYTHSIKYAFGSLSGYITADGSLSASEVKLTATSIPFTVPSSFYAQIPNAASGECTLTCKTYSGSTQIGDAQTAKLTVTADKSKCAPAVSGTVVDSREATKALTGDGNKFIRYMSDALCTIAASAKNSATLTEKSIGGVTVTGDTRTISGIDSTSVKFYAKDSRGHNTTVTISLEKSPYSMIPYVRLTGVLSAGRTDPTSGNAVLSVKGNCYNGSFGAEDNSLTVRYKVGSGEYAAMEPVLDGNTYTAEVSLSGLDYQSSHTLTVEIADKLETVTKSVTIGKGIPVFDWGEEDFSFHVPVSMDGKKITDMADPEKDQDGANKGYVDTALKNHTHAASDIGSGTLAAERLPTVPLNKGGTGATTAADARSNLGIGAAKLYSGSLGSGSASYSGSYSLYIIIGRTGTSNSLGSLVLPAAVCDGETKYQLFADGEYINFTVSATKLTIGTASGGGVITGIYGVN